MVRTVSFVILMLTLVAGVAFADNSATEKANIEMCKKFYAEVVNGGKLDMMDVMMTDDFVENEQIPGLASGREGVKQFFQMLRAAFPDLKFDVEFYLADGDKVVAYLTMSGTQKGEFMGMPPTGRKFSTKTVDIIRFVDGKAVEHWGATDTMSMMEQLGADMMGAHGEHSGKGQ